MISIITINLNNKDGLKETINSVISQTYKDIEYIIIDGGFSYQNLGLMNDEKKEYYRKN